MPARVSPRGEKTPSCEPDLSMKAFVECVESFTCKPETGRAYTIDFLEDHGVDLCREGSQFVLRDLDVFRGSVVDFGFEGESKFNKSMKGRIPLAADEPCSSAMLVSEVITLLPASTFSILGACLWLSGSWFGCVDKSRRSKYARNYTTSQNIASPQLNINSFSSLEMLLAQSRELSFIWGMLRTF